MKQQEIKRYIAGDPITRSQLEQLHSLTATHGAPTVSNKYSFLPTMEIIDLIKGQGWYPVLAQERNSRKPETEGFQKHMIKFRQKGATPLKRVGDLIPELVLTNSHNGKASYSLRLGFFRLACSNGLIVADAVLGCIHIRHIGIESKEVTEASNQIISSIPATTKKILEYKAFMLTRLQQEEFTVHALTLRYKRGEQKITRGKSILRIGRREFSIPEVLKPQRQQDTAPSLWNTFNTIQEKVANGYEFAIKKGEITKARGIKGINRNLKFNTGLWNLMEETLNS